MFLSSEHFNLFYSGGLSKVSYLVPCLWFLCLFVVVAVLEWITCSVMCKRCPHVNHINSDQFDRCV